MVDDRKRKQIIRKRRKRSEDNIEQDRRYGDIPDDEDE